MFDEDNNKKDDRGPKKPPGGFKVPMFTWVAWIAIIGSVVALMMVKNHLTTQTGNNMSQSEFLQKFASNQIAHATISYNPQSLPLTQISGTYYEADKNGNIVMQPNGKPTEESFVIPNA